MNIENTSDVHYYASNQHTDASETNIPTHPMTKQTRHIFTFLLLPLLALMLFASCKVSKPKGILSESQMERILYDYHLLRPVAQASADSSNIKMRAYLLACLKRHGVTEAEFDSSMVWYCQHPATLQRVYQRIDDRYSSELTTLGVATNTINRYSSLSATGDTANIWNGRTFYLLSSNGFNNRIPFEVKADSSFKKGDSFMFNFRAEFLQKEGQRHIVVALAVEYENDSVAHVQRHFYSSGDNTIEIPSTPLLAKRVYGYVYMITEWDDNPRLLFLFHPSIVKMKGKEPEPENESKESTAPTDSTTQLPDSTAKSTQHTSTDSSSTIYSRMFNIQSPSTPGLHSRPTPRKMNK